MPAFTPPLPAHDLLQFLIALLVLLLLARVFARVAERVGMPAVVGELLVGLVLGPSVLGVLAPDVVARMLPVEAGPMHLVDAVGQLGLLLLVGITGTHLDLGMLRRRRTTALRVSLAGLLLPLASGVALGFVLPAAFVGQDQTGRVPFALFLGVAMAVTAIPVIAKILSDLRMLHRDVAQLTLAAGMVDDTVAWCLLAVVSAAATVGVTAAGVGLTVGSVAAFLVVAFVAGRPVVRWVMTRAGNAAEPGPTVAAAVLVMLGGAVAAHALGLEPIFGTFVAGCLVGTGGVDQAKLAPLRTVVLCVLAPIFLATAGLRMDLTALADADVAAAGAAVLAVAVVGKFAGAYLGARLSRLTGWEAVALGAGMNARGAVEVVVAMTGLRLGVLSVASYTIVVLVAIVTSVMAPGLLKLAMARVPLTAAERRREAEHRSWARPDGGVAPPAPPDLVAAPPALLPPA